MPYSDHNFIKAGLKPSPSLQYNNLCRINGNLLYVHGKEVCSFAVAGISPTGPVSVKKMEAQHADVIYSVASCIHNDHTYMILATNKGIQIWDENACHLLHTWALPSDAVASSSSTSIFARGICTTITSEGTGHICFGSSSGSLYGIPILEDNKFGPTFEIKQHKAPITCLSSSYQSRRGNWAADVGCEVVSCDEDGMAVFWQASVGAGGYRVLQTIASKGVPCVSAAVRNDFAILARLDGAIQIYGIRDGKLRADIGGHSRFLSSMDLHPQKDIVVTSSEDATVNIWTLPIGGNRAENLLSVAWLNAPITGVTFCGPNNNDIAVVAYDTEEIYYYKYQ